MTTLMTLTRLPFYPVYLVGILGSLAIFSGVIGGGRLTGPGIALSLSVGALLWVGRLLFESARSLVSVSSAAEKSEAVAASGRRRKELEREYYILKRAIKELELDHAMGKVSAEDYGEIRVRYRERAVRVLRQLDQGESYRAQIEADLAARRTARGLAAKPVSLTQAPAVAADEKPAVAAVSEQPAMVSAAPAEVVAAPTAVPVEVKPQPAPASDCAACGTRNDADARFCKGCGGKLGAPPPVA
jgi:hypothetical protein